MSILSTFPLITQTKPLSPYNNKPGYLSGNSFFEYGNKTIYFKCNNEEDYLKAYRMCPSLKAVINRRAQYFVNGRYVILNNNTDKPLRGEQARQIQSLLDKPNILQTGKQFKAQHNIYIDIFGWCPVLKVSPIGFPNSVYALWNLPPWLFTPKMKKVDFWEMSAKGKNTAKDLYESFTLNWNGENRVLDMDAIFIVLDNSIGTDDDGNLHLPDSRIKSLEYPISNEMAARMAANTSITRKGPNGILSNDPGSGQYAPLKIGNERAAIQNDFARYGLTGQEWQVIITDASLRWQQMGSPVKDMMLFETINDAQNAICDGMGIYTFLMAGSGKNTTFANLNEAKKSQYQDFVIPDDNARTEQLSSGIIPDEDRPYITVDYSHVEVLQESEQAKAVTDSAKAAAYQAKYDLGIMTRNDILKDQGLPTVDLPEMNNYSWQQVTPLEPPARFPTQANAE